MGTEKNRSEQGEEEEEQEKYERELEVGGKINSSSVRILLKANRKKLYIQTYRCVYISFSA